MSCLENINRTVRHERDPKMKYEPRATDAKSSIMHCGQLKLLCMETAFLTEWGKPNDVVVYVGGGNGIHLPTLARMFPTTRFDVFDVKPLNSLVLGETSSRIKFATRRFDVKDAEEYAKMGDKVIFFSDIRPKPPASGLTTDKKLAAVHEDCLQDLAEQKAWLEAVVPRQALIRFRVPYDTHKTIEYLDGEMYLQPFTKRSSSEVRLHVAQPDPETKMYKTKTYDCIAHEECMFHHNCVTRRQHIGPRLVDTVTGAPIGKRAISYDHKLAHAIIQAWVDKAHSDPDHTLCHGLSGPALDKHIVSVLTGLDIIYGKMLGLRWSEQFAHIVKAS